MPQGPQTLKRTHFQGYVLLPIHMVWSVLLRVLAPQKKPIEIEASDCLMKNISQPEGGFWNLELMNGNKSCASSLCTFSVWSHLGILKDVEFFTMGRNN